jgi:hypothetical protein
MRPLQGLAREERQAEEPAQPEPEPAAGVMSLIERRWTITFDSEGRPRDVGEHADARALHNGWTTVEVIPAADARGAVENAKQARTALEHYLASDDRDEQYVMDALAHLGGQ